LVNTAITRSPAPYRDGEHAAMVDVVGTTVEGDRSLDSLTAVGRLFDQLGFVAVGPGTDVVGDVHRLVGRGSHLIDDQPLAGCRAHVQQEIGEAEIGKERPLGGEPVQVVDVVAFERRVLAGQFGERGHRR
jgi:hypothetical protein